MKRAMKLVLSIVLALNLIFSTAAFSGVFVLSVDSLSQTNTNSNATKIAIETAESLTIEKFGLVNKTIVKEDIKNSLDRTEYDKIVGFATDYATSRESEFLQASTDNIKLVHLGNDSDNKRIQQIEAFANRLNIKIEDAITTSVVTSYEKSRDLVTISLYEWTFYDYDDLSDNIHTIDVSGYGIEHTISLKDDNDSFIIISDTYFDDMVEVDPSAVNKVGISDEPILDNNMDIEVGKLSATSMSTNFYTNYNPDAVAVYADQWVYSGASSSTSGVWEQYYNPAYYNFNSVGGDCANYTSQAILAGGMPQVYGTPYGQDGWYYTASNNRSGTWTMASYLRTWMANNRGVLVDSPSAADIYKGSPVFYDWYNDGSWDHATICVGTNSAGTPIIDSHNNDKYHVNWNYGYSSTIHSTVQLTPYNNYIPSTPTLSSNSSVYGLWSDATFNFNAQGATRIVFSIYYNYGAELYFTGEFAPQSSYTRQFGAAGQYSCCFTAYYPGGSFVESAWLGFTVVEDISVYFPAPPDVWVSDSTILQDEEFTLHFWSEKASFYRVNVYLENDLFSTTDYYVSSATISLPTVGNYEVRVAAINDFGHNYGYVNFPVLSAIPDKPYIAFSKDAVAQDESITINFWSERATRYWVGIYKEGELLLDEYTYFGNYTVSFIDMGQYDVIIAADNSYGWQASQLSFIVYSNAPINMLTQIDSTTVINHENGYIYGLQAGVTKAHFENNLVQLQGYARLEYSTISDTLCTGTKVNLVSSLTDEIVQSYTVLLFGDVNGDGNIDSIDAGTMVDYENYMFSWDPTSDTAYLKAGDLNGDGNVDSIDAGIAVDAENYLVTIDQTTGLAS